MDNLWKQYQNTSDALEKEGAWRELLPQLIQLHCKASTPFAGCTELTNTLATRFLSAIDEQCSVSEESDNLVLFLTNGYGCQLLLGLNLFASQITNCCSELCNLLLSIVPLAIQSAKFENERSVEIFIPKNDSVSNRAHFLSISQYLSGFSVNSGESDASSDDESASLSLKNNSTEADNEIDLINKIKKLKFDNCQLFFHLVSTLLGLVQNDSMPKEEDGFISYADKCFAYLLSSNMNLTSYHQLGLSSILFSLLFEISAHKDGPVKILSSPVYSNYQTFIQSCIDKGNQENLLLSLDSMKHLLNCMSQSVGLLSNPSSHNSEVFQLLSKFTQLNFFDLLKSMLVNIDGDDLQDETSRQCFQYLDAISKLLVKIVKKLKSTRNFCNGVSSIGQLQQRMHPLRDSKHNRKCFSSEEEGQQKLIMKRLPDFDNTDEGEEESAENVSDFDNFLFYDTTDSDLEVKKEKSTSSIKQKPVDLPTSSKKDICFFSCCLNSLCNTFSIVKKKQSLQLLLLQTMGQIGLCKCMDIDSFLSPIVSMLTKCNTKVADKSLSLVSYLLSSNLDNISTKGPSKRKSTSRTRTKSRSLSSSSNQYNDEKSDLEVPTPVAVHFQFLEKFKALLNNEPTPFKNLLLKHLKVMTQKMPLNMQHKLFSTILLPNFRSLFPLGKLDKIDVPFSLSDDVDLIKNHLDLISICLTNNSTLVVLFCKYEGIEILKKLSEESDEELTLRAVYLLDYLCWLTKLDADKSKSANKKNTDEKQKASNQEIAYKAINSVFQIAHKQTDEVLADFNPFVLVKKNTLMENFTNVLDLFYDKDFVSVLDTSILIKFGTMFSHLTQQLPGTENALSWPVFLKWIEVLLPLQMVDCKGGFSRGSLLSQLDKLFFNNESLPIGIFEKSLMTLLQTTVVGSHEIKTWEVLEKEELIHFDLKSPVMDSAGGEDLFEKPFSPFEEEGYEADQDSDGSTENGGNSSQLTYLVKAEHKNNTSLHGKEALKTPLRVMHPWLINILLRKLADKIDLNHTSTAMPFLKILKVFLGKILEFQIADATNNSLLKQEGLLSTLLEKFGDCFKQNNCIELVEIQDVLGKIIVTLSLDSIPSNELKKLLALFKVEDINKAKLSKILLAIAKDAKAKDGPQYHLTFPVGLLKEPSNLSQSKLLHRTQAFMIPKQEQGFCQSQLRSQSLSSMYEKRGDTLKPISYSNQPACWESAAIQLPLASDFYWPDNEFAICLWYMLEENTLKTASADSSFREKSKYNNIKLISQKQSSSQESYGCEELYHMTSFGGPNAMFEIWIGARTGYFQYRWITSCYGCTGDEQLMTFDQVVVQHRSQKNKWHHLIVSLVLPSEPHTAEVTSFLNGVQIPSVQMKYPSNLVQSHVKLSLLVGHGTKLTTENKNVLQERSNNVLKTGTHMVFQGKDSILAKDKNNSGGVGRRQPLVDKMKAVYLYQLGPNSTTINTDYQEYFSNQTASHMDSSLDWDSIVFKELSFCMSCISEDLVQDKFPMKLLESPMEVLADIKCELQTSLMLIYNPRNVKEFSQFIPQLKTSGNVQHTFMTDEVVSGDSGNEGTILPVILHGNITTTEVESFKQAIHTCGGMSVLLYLHAKVAEHQYSEEAQAAILKTIFLVQESCPFLLRELNDFAGYVLIKRAIEQSPCDLTPLLMKTLLEATCDGDLFISNSKNDDDGFNSSGSNSFGDLDNATTVINQNTSAVVKNVCILQMLLKDWSLIRKADFDVQEILWQCLETLVRPTHPHSKFNVAQFQRVRVVENLLVGCQEVQQEKYFQLPQKICKLFIGVISNLLGQPVDLPVLRAVCAFLIAIHPTLDTLTLHSASNFYLIAKSTGSTQSNSRIKLCDSSSQISRSERRRKTASFNEADLLKRPLIDLDELSPQVILSQEDLTSGSSVFQSEVIIRRGSNQSLKESMVALASTPFKRAPNMQFTPPVEYDDDGGLDETDSRLRLKKSAQQTPAMKKIKGHRRIQSDGNIRPASIATVTAFTTSTSNQITLNVSPSTPIGNKDRPPFTSAESQDFEIISDSELASSLEEGHEEYLVVDGFIDQTMESFTPKAKREHQFPAPDVLYYLRLGLMQLLKNTLMLLPDNLVTSVLGAILKVEHLLVLVNQTSDKLREIALENLILYLKRGGRDCLANFNRFKGCHLLANQLHQHPITMRIVESCITLLISKPISLNTELTKQFDLNEENICFTAIVPCLTLLEGSTQRPPIFGQIVKFLLKVFDLVENLPLVAFDHGLAEIVCNIVCGLANEESGGVMTSWKKESFGHLLSFLDWLVEKACRTCQTLYFQMYKDLQLNLENVDVREKEKKGHASTTLLSKTCRFLKYYLIQKALNVFRENDLYRVNTKGDTTQFVMPANHVYDTGNKAGTAARSLIKRIRGSVQMLPPPTIATPSEIQERFQEILSEAVKLATLFTKNTSEHTTTDVFMFGHKLGGIGGGSGDDGRVVGCEGRSTDADLEFCKDLFDWFCQNLHLILCEKAENTSWYALLKSIKEEIVAQASHLFINFASPLRSQEVRLYFVRQFMRFKDDKPMVQMFLLSHLERSKRRDKFLACLHSILSMSHAQLTSDDTALLKLFKKTLGRTSLVKMNDQRLLTEMKETKQKKKEEELGKRRTASKRILERNSALCRSIADHGMEVSKVIVEEQDRQRQKLLRVVRGKVSKDVEVRKTWRNLIHHCTQERALWHHEESYPCSWQLDPTEGPFRMRKRLQRCHLEIAPKFFMDDAPAKKPIHHNGLLSYLFMEPMDGEQPRFYSFKTNDTIRFLYHCKRVTPATKNSGEVLIGETHMYFVGDEILVDNNVTQAFFGDKDVISISWRYEEIHEILKRRYALQDNALEIFLTSGRTFLLSFENTKCRDEVHEQLYSRELPNLATATMDLTTLTTRWKEGLITNFEYLTELNKKAGRSFNDLMQYPVLPFVLADYESDVLDLTNPSTFRNFIKPIACQDKGKEERYIENYEYLKAEHELRKLDDPENATPPYHYSSHYSNSGTVLHFLVRLPPFTSMFLKYQDNQFDIPDRTFHSMGTTWKLSSFISSTDVKELIPEFFFLQEFLQNGEQYDMGQRQNKERVDNVHLPVWSKNDPRLFTLIHMQALESSMVSVNIHHWIDLVFGVKQSGPAAIKATNVFHPATYFGVDVSAIKDDIHRRALETMIETYGQTPLQLFPSPHPKRFSKAPSSLIEMFPQTMENIIILNPSKPKETKESPSLKSEHLLLPDVCKSPLDTVIGIQWGNYCGSKAHPSPVVQWVQTLSFSPTRIITASSSSLSAYLCQENTCVLTSSALSSISTPIGILSWQKNDGLLHVQSTSSARKSVFNPMRPDRVTCCEFIPEMDILFVGGSSGILSVWPVRFLLYKPSLDVVGAKQNLLGHSDGITSICICQPYSVAVTTSKDRTAIIWDLNRLCYIRSIVGHESSVQCTTVNDASGDIATACNLDGKGFLYLWTINAKPVGRLETSSSINCLAFSTLPDGVAINVVAAGLKSGHIRMWDTWTLNPIRTLTSSSLDPVTAMSFSKWNAMYFFSADQRGNVSLWTSNDTLTNSNRKPNFVLVATLP